jgi:hypothetical protein
VYPFSRWKRLGNWPLATKPKPAEPSQFSGHVLYPVRSSHSPPSSRTFGNSCHRKRQPETGRTFHLATHPNPPAGPSQAS